MDQDQLQAQAAGIFTRAKAIITAPDTEWPKIAGETDQPMQVFLRYALPLAALGPIASFIGGQVFGLGGFGISVKIGLAAGLTMAITSFVLGLASLWLVAFVANLLSPKFGGKDDFAAAFRLIAYAFTASWVAAIVGLVPMLGILALLGSLYSLYLLYKGVTPVMGVPQDKAVGFTVVTVLAAFVANIVVGLIVAAISGPALMAGAMASGGADEVSIDMGVNGSIQSGADGTMTITGPDGEEMTITVNDGK